MASNQYLVSQMHPKFRFKGDNNTNHFLSKAVFK